MWERGLRYEKVGKNVRPKCLLELFWSNVLEIPFRIVLSCVVNYHIEPAKLAKRSADRFETKLMVTHVSGDKETPTPFGLDESRCFLRILMFIEINHGHIGALGGECNGHRSAAAVTPRDQSYLILAFPASRNCFSLDLGRGAISRSLPG